MCNPPNGFFAASPSTRCAARLYTRIAFPMLVPLTFIIDITLTKYGVVVNNGYGILCVILEKIYSIPAPFQTNFSVSVICCQSSRQDIFLRRKQQEPCKAPAVFRRSQGRSFVAGEVGNGGEALFQIGVGGDTVAHVAVVVLAIGHHIKVAGTRQAEDDGLGLAGFAALDRLVNGHRMAWLLSGAGRMPSQRANCSAAAKTLVCSTLRTSR